MFRGQSLSSRISDSTPKFCTIYAVSKGKLLSVRPSDPEINGSSSAGDSFTSCSITSSTVHTSSSLTGKNQRFAFISLLLYVSPNKILQLSSSFAYLGWTCCLRLEKCLTSQGVYVVLCSISCSLWFINDMNSHYHHPLI